jgi:hypothetical protein
MSRMEGCTTSPSSAGHMNEEISPGASALLQPSLCDLHRPKRNGESLRGVARELGMRLAVLQEFPEGMVEHRATASPAPVDARQAESAVRALLSGLAPECQDAAERELTETLRSLYPSWPPRWLQDLAPRTRENA